MNDKLAFIKGELKGSPSLPLLNQDGEFQGHFKTNFAVDQKEGVENTEFDNQQEFRRLPFETSFKSVRQEETFLHGVDTILVPAHSPEIVTSGVWTSVANSSTKFGKMLQSNISGDFIELEFSGVSCSVACQVAGVSGDAGSLHVQIKVAGTNTFFYAKRFTAFSSEVIDLNNRLFHLYSGLQYNTYVVRITHIDTNTNLSIDYFSYTTHMIQRPAQQYYHQTEAIGEKSITDFSSNVVNATAHGFTEGHRVQFIDSTPANIPPELNQITEYYVLFIDVNSFQISLTEGGVALSFSSSFSGTTLAHFSISNCPPTTILLTGIWATHSAASGVTWNTFYHRSDPGGDGDYVEFKFFGSKCWVNSWWNADRDVDVDIFIDGSQAKSRFNSFNTSTGGATVGEPSWIRLDDDTLSEGFHTIKLVSDPVQAGQFFLLGGFGFYSKDITTDTTVKRNLICGKESFSLGVDEAVTTDSGGWTGPQEGVPPSTFLRREDAKLAGTSSDFIQLTTTPTDPNLKAIYYITSINSGTQRGKLEFTLAGKKKRRIDLFGTTTQDNLIFQIYDKVLDGPLNSVALRVSLLESAGITFEGFIFEIGDAVETDSIYCMPKWTRYNDFSEAGNFLNAVSITQRLDVFGLKTDLREGRKPSIQSGWLNTGTIVKSFRHGCGFVAHESPINVGKAENATDQHPFVDYRNSTGTLSSLVQKITNGDPGLAEFRFGDSSFPWGKAVMTLPRVI